MNNFINDSIAGDFELCNKRNFQKEKLNKIWRYEIARLNYKTIKKRSCNAFFVLNLT